MNDSNAAKRQYGNACCARCGRRRLDAGLIRSCQFTRRPLCGDCYRAEGRDMTVMETDIREGTS